MLQPFFVGSSLRDGVPINCQAFQSMPGGSMQLNLEHLQVRSCKYTTEPYEKHQDLLSGVQAPREIYSVMMQRRVLTWNLSGGENALLTPAASHASVLFWVLLFLVLFDPVKEEQPTLVST